MARSKTNPARTIADLQAQIALAYRNKAQQSRDEIAAIKARVKVLRAEIADCVRKAKAAEKIAGIAHLAAPRTAKKAKRKGPRVTAAGTIDGRTKEGRALAKKAKKKAAKIKSRKRRKK